jgi:hypothetical protein
MMKKDFQTIAPSLELTVITGKYYNDTVLGAAKRIQDMLQAVTPHLEVQKVMSAAWAVPETGIAKHLQDAMKAVTPHLEVQKVMSAAWTVPETGIAKHLQDAMKAVTPHLEVQKVMSAAWAVPETGIAKHLQDAMKAVTPHLEMQKAMSAAWAVPETGIAKHLQDALHLNQFVEIRKSIMSSIAYKTHVEHMSLAKIVGDISPVLAFYREIPINKIVINGKNQTINYDSESININSLKIIIKDIIDNINIQNNYLHNIFLEIQKLKKPFLEKIIVWIIIPLLISIFSSFINQSIKNYYNYHHINNKHIIKIIEKKLIKSNIDLEALRMYRIVMVDELNVRKQNKRSSTLLGKICFGQIVKEIERKKNWSHVEWIDDNDESAVIRGWVFSRYLKKF